MTELVASREAWRRIDSREETPSGKQLVSDRPDYDSQWAEVRIAATRQVELEYLLGPVVPKTLDLTDPPLLVWLCGGQTPGRAGRSAGRHRRG